MGGSEFSRREVFRVGGRVAAVAAGGAALGPLVAACGKGPGGSAGGSSSGGVSPAVAGGVAASVVDQLKQILPVPTGKAAGKGLAIKVAVADAYSGSYAANGVDRYKAEQLAVKHIAALGGPSFSLQSVDTQANPANAPTYMRRFGLSGIPVMLTAAAGNSFSEMPFYEQYKMLALDCGGANKLGEGKPFYYMTRAEVPGQIMPLLLEYAKQKLPHIKSWVVIGDDYGAQNDQLSESELDPTFAQYGYAKPTYVFQPVGSSDYSTSLSKIRAANPDAIMQYEFGTPVSLFMNQYATSGIGKPVFAMDYSVQMAQVAKSSFTNMYFGFDYFDDYNPPNAWAKLFVQEFEKTYQYTPSYYCANGYETAFLLWEMVARILAAGGDPTQQGDHYVDAISKQPSTFWSVYGSGSGKYGTMTINPKTHGLSNRPIALLQAHGNPNTPPTLLATSGISGTNYQAAA